MTPIFSAAYYFCLLSLAWIPLTAGFIGKFLVLLAGAGVAKWLLAIVLVLSSVIGLYYYLRLIVGMIRPGDEDRKSTRLNSSHVATSCAVCWSKTKRTEGHGGSGGTAAGG